MDYTVHGILQARILGWVAFPFSRGSSQPRDRNQVFHTAGGFFTSWAIREAQDLPDPGIEPGFTALQMDSLQTELLGKSKFKVSTISPHKNERRNQQNWKQEISRENSTDGSLKRSMKLIKLKKEEINYYYQELLRYHKL